MNESIVQLIWKRPETLDYPKVWHTFQAKDADTDNLVDYRIEDLTEARTKAASDALIKHFIRDEPLCNAFGVTDDPEAELENIKQLWEPIIKQRMALVCYKTGSEEIVGLNMNFVASKGEHFFENIQERLVSEKNVRLFTTMGLVYENFDLFEHYGVDKYLSSAGLLVTPNYRGRHIGEQFLVTREAICKEFGIKLTATVFTSDYSNRSADKVGFKLDASLSYDDIHKKHPELEGIGNVKSKYLTLKSLSY